MCVKEGFYKYKVNDDLDLEYKALPSSLQGESGEQLFRLKNKKYSTDPKHIYIPYNKWEKINL
jgi:hypothetical protein